MCQKEGKGMNRDDTELILSEKFAPADLPDVCAPRLRVMGTVERAVLESPARCACAPGMRTL